MSCPNCRTKKLVEIAMTLRERRVVRHSCSSCELRWWDVEGKLVDLDNVLELAAKKTA